MPAVPKRRAIGAKQEPVQDVTLKALLLGDSAVGKSSLLLRFCEGRFESSFVLTIGVDFKSKFIEADGEIVKLQLWDTAGQERFRTITPAYYRAAMGIVLVYDCTNQTTFDNVRYWIKNLEEHAAGDILKILVANKTDLMGQKVISTEIGQELASEYNIPFFETSAKLNLNVEEAFLTMARMIQEERLSSMVADGTEQPSLHTLRSSESRTKKPKCC